MRISKVTTKTGDKGLTALVGGSRVSKASLRVGAYGDADELNSYLGVIRSSSLSPEVDAILGEIQNTLFVVGCDLASPPDVDVPRTSKDHIKVLDGHLDRIQTQLPPLEEFVLPGGSEVGARLHYARTIARRVERAVVRLSGVESVTPEAIAYLNRLSDLLFVLGRAVNANDGVAEPLARFSSKGDSGESS